MKVPIARTVFEESEFEAVLKPLKSGWIVQGPAVKEFEDAWSSFTGAEHSIAVSSCTTALHLCLSALGIGPGDEVIVPAFTWVATANVVEAQFAKPVFCDIDLRTFNIDVTKLEHLVTPRTKAIIPVHLFGAPAEMSEIGRIAQKHNLAVIEDAACGFASRYRGRHVGLFGKAGCFSFHPRKAITTGEGGMITTSDGDYAAKLRSMRDHGAAMSDLQRHFGNRPYLLPEFPNLGFNYRMTDIQASIGVTQMARAEEIHRKRVSLADRYDQALSGLSWIATPERNADWTHGFQAYVCLFGGSEIGDVETTNRKRNEFMDYLQQQGISTRPGTHAVHLLAYYRDRYEIRAEDFPNCYRADQWSIAFPLFPDMKDEEFDYVVQTIKNWKY